MEFLAFCPNKQAKNQSQKGLKETGEIPHGELTNLKMNEQFTGILNLGFLSFPDDLGVLFQA